MDITCYLLVTDAGSEVKIELTESETILRIPTRLENVHQVATSFDPAWPPARVSSEIRSMNVSLNQANEDCIYWMLKVTG